MPERTQSMREPPPHSSATLCFSLSCRTQTVTGFTVVYPFASHGAKTPVVLADAVGSLPCRENICESIEDSRHPRHPTFGSENPTPQQTVPRLCTHSPPQHGTSSTSQVITMSAGWWRDAFQFAVRPQVREESHEAYDLVRRCRDYWFRRPLWLRKPNADESGFIQFIGPCKSQPQLLRGRHGEDEGGTGEALAGRCGLG
ncbi:MAG: hypothetical protein KatS3mg114_0968 [Planctomycetaceae bacterium]|nr:MAG: hypothetical protein KatS3mg114_0968 [Planctomycetaceae bacterium]